MPLKSQPAMTSVSATPPPDMAPANPPTGALLLPLLTAGRVPSSTLMGSRTSVHELLPTASMNDSRAGLLQVDTDHLAEHLDKAHRDLSGNAVDEVALGDEN